MLTDAELDQLLLAIARWSGPIAKQDLQRRARRVVDWAARIRVDAAVLELVLRGELDIEVPERGDEPLGFVRRREDEPPTPASGNTAPRSSPAARRGR